MIPGAFANRQRDGVFLARNGAILALLAANAWPGLPAWGQEPLPEIPEDLRPEAGNQSRLPEDPLKPRYDPDGSPEDARGLLVAYRESDAFWVDMRGDPEAILLYAQFANRQRDGVWERRRSRSGG